jgi:hypothetical protein
MKQQSLTGIWELKERDEVYSDDIVKKENKDDKDDFIIPEKEILYFPDCEGLVYQIGLRNKTGQADSGTEPYKRYEVCYNFPCEYNEESKEICTVESGTYQLKDKGFLYLSLHADDYVCQEIWERKEEDVDELIHFITDYISKDGEL